MTLIVCLGIFFVMLLVGLPVLLCLGFSCTVWLLVAGNGAAYLMAQKVFVSIDSFSIMAIPFFMMAGEIMEHTGITKSLVKLASSIIGWVRGGIAMTVELAGMLLAGLSGSANADTAALGVLCFPSLKEAGYDEGMACSIVCSAGGLGPIIPPSLIMIIYASVAGLNVGTLFMAGILPGVLLGVGYMVICYFYAQIHNLPRTPFGGFRNIWNCFIGSFGALLMPVIIIFGIVSGIFTVTEAGMAAVLYGMLYGLLTKKLDLKSLVRCVKNGAVTSVNPILLLAFSNIFAYMLAREGVVSAIGKFCVAHISSGIGLMLFLTLITVIGGCFMDGAAIVLILTPIMMPVVKTMGVDPIQFSMVFMLAIMVGGMTPPVGAQLFIVSATSKTPITKIAKPIMAFIAMEVLMCVLVTFIPGIATWIPSILRS